MVKTSSFSSSSLYSLYLLVFILVLRQSSLTESHDRHVIKFRSPGLYPDGLTWDPTSQHFIVASLKRGTFHSISDAGVIETLTLTSSASILSENTSILGLAVDHRHSRLLAAVNTASSPYLAAFSLHRTSLSLIFLSPLPTPSPSSAVANAVTVDPHGNAYVTNSAENFIWKVTLNGTASILSTSWQFTRYPNVIDHNTGLNGVVYVPGKEYLLVLQTNTGKIFKVDVIDGTARSVILPLDLTLPEKIAVKDNGVIIINSKSDAWILKSDDSWGQAGVIDKIAIDKEGCPTSVSVGGGGRVYVLYGYGDEGTMGISHGEEEREWFRIEEIKGKRESDDVDNVWVYVMVGFAFVYFLFWRFQMGQLVKNMDKKHS